jgi:hypothetical protein
MSNDDVTRNRRSSVTSAALSSLFQRSNSTSAGSSGTSGNSLAAAAARDQRRRLSVTTLGLSGTGPASAAPFAGFRRGSISTNNSDSIDENAVDDEDAARTAPTTPFVRRMSFGTPAMRSAIRASGGSSPGTSGTHDLSRRSSGGATSRTPPLTTSAARRISVSQASTAQSTRTHSDMLSSAARSDQGYNWSEQLRSRAESTVTGARSSFGAGMASSPPRAGIIGNGQHDRSKSVAEMPAPPQQAAVVKPKAPERQKPDHMQERILKGDFYMD